MSDALAILMAIAAAAGALAAIHVPLVIGLGLAAAAFLGRWPLMLVFAVTFISSALAAGAWDGLAPPPAGPVSGVARLVTDPEEVAGALRVELTLHGRHVEAWARGAPAGALVHRAAGERLEVTGRLRPVSEAMRGRLARRHIAAQLAVERVGRWWGGPLPVRAANALRAALLRGARPMPTTERSLFAGFVLGDDRDQPPSVADDFRGSGLTHLLVVSGENVAFVLALASPILARVGLRTRLVLGIAVLAGFGLVTRWEPSVMRAAAMAAIAMTATALGRPVSTLRVLALAVTALLLLDPMLVRSVGFLLSVGACVGIATLAEPIAARLPGPRAIAKAVAVTAAAQVGVAPILIPVFGPLPIAALPANLLAVPLAGPIMVWGMTAGIVAGVCLPLAPALHLPTRILIAAVALIARTGARLPLGRVTLWQVMALPALVVGHRYTAALRSRRAAARRGTELRVGHPVPGDGDPQPHA